MNPFELTCECGHGTREHAMSLSPLYAQPCRVDGCACKDFKRAVRERVTA